jgi:hypothetical protein
MKKEAAGIGNDCQPKIERSSLESVKLSAASY